METIGICNVISISKKAANGKLWPFRSKIVIAFFLLTELQNSIAKKICNFTVSQTAAMVQIYM